MISCTTQRLSTITSVEYDDHDDITTYTELPLGVVDIPGQWEKAEYNSVSHQQFFLKPQKVKLGVAFNPTTVFEFNPNGDKSGLDFVQAFYRWDTDYFHDTYGLENEIIEIDSARDFIIYRVYGEMDDAEMDSYFLIAERNGKMSSFSISSNDEWTRNETIQFLNNLYLP